MSLDWRTEPISRKQISMLKSVDDWFTFDRLKGMTKGEASDYIEEYYKDKKIIEENINMRYNKERVEGISRLDVNGLVREVINEAAGIVLSRYGI